MMSAENLAKHMAITLANQEEKATILRAWETDIRREVREEILSAIRRSIQDVQAGSEGKAQASTAAQGPQQPPSDVASKVFQSKTGPVPVSQEAQDFQARLYECEPPCDSYGKCSNCCDQDNFECGYVMGYRAAKAPSETTQTDSIVRDTPTTVTKETLSKGYAELRDAVLWSGSNDWTPPDAENWKRIIAVVRKYDTGDVAPTAHQEGNIVQIRSDLWYRRRNGVWVEMTLEEQEMYT